MGTFIWKSLDTALMSLYHKRLKMSQKFALKSHDHLANWKNSLSKLRNDKEFTDVTLICEDKVKFPAHKVLLSSCSSMFKFVLEGHNNAIPLLYLGGVSSENLKFILDYIYYGEIILFQEKLESFLESANKLEIDGLVESMENEKINQEEPIKYHKYEQSQILDHDPPIISKRQCIKAKENFMKQEELFKCREFEQSQTLDVHAPVIPKRQYVKSSDLAKIDVSSMTSEEIVEKRKELCQKINGLFCCTDCKYVTKDKSNLNKHIETHLVGLVYRCNHCNQEFSKHTALIKHNIEHNKNN